MPDCEPTQFGKPKISMAIITTKAPQDAVKTAETTKDDVASLTEALTAVPVENEALARYASDLAFLHEDVEVLVAPSNDPNDTTRLVEVTVNGRTQFFMRGEWVKCKRYFVEALSRAKREQYTFGYKKAADGSTVQTESAQQGHRYVFQVKDANPKGAAWLQQLMGHRV